MAENRGYMQRYAMLFGTYMGGFWILKFILFPVGLSVPFLLFLFMGLTLCVPFMGYYYARMYRNQVCGGGISFLHAWVFTVFMYMFAAVAHYIYFRFIDHGYVINTCETMVDTLAQSNMPGMKEIEFEILDIIENDEGKFYVLYPFFENPEDAVNDSGEYYIFEVTEIDGEEELAEIEDDDKLDRIAAVFEERYNEEFYDEDD